MLCEQASVEQDPANDLLEAKKPAWRLRFTLQTSTPFVNPLRGHIAPARTSRQTTHHRSGSGQNCPFERFSDSIANVRLNRAR